MNVSEKVQQFKRRWKQPNKNRFYGTFIWTSDIDKKTFFMGSEGTVAYHCDNNYNVKLRHYSIPLWQQL